MSIINEVDHRAITDDNFFVVTINLKTIVDAKDGELSERCQRLINETYSIQLRANKLTEELNANNLVELETAREAKVIECRDAKYRYDNLIFAKAQLDEQGRRLGRELQRAESLRWEIKNSPPNPTISLKSDIEAWKDKVKDADNNTQNALDATNAHQQVIAEYNNKCNQTGTEFNNLAIQEAELRMRINKLKGVSETVAQPRRSAIGL